MIKSAIAPAEQISAHEWLIEQMCMTNEAQKE